MIDLKKELESNQTILLIMSGDKYNDLIGDIIKPLSDKNICYVTLNKTSSALMELFKKKKIKNENILYIDAISKALKKSPDQCDKCYFVSSPAALTELSLVTNKFLKHKFDCIIVDSITNLSTYQKDLIVLKFITTLINKVKASKTKAVFYAIDIKEQENLIKQAGVSVDKVINLTK